MFPGRNDKGHDNEAEGIWNVSLFRDAHRIGGSDGELTVEGSVTTPFRKKNADHSEMTRSNRNTVRQN